MRLDKLSDTYIVHPVKSSTLSPKSSRTVPLAVSALANPDRVSSTSWACLYATKPGHVSLPEGRKMTRLRDYALCYSSASALK